MKKFYIILSACLLIAVQALIAGPVDETTARQTALRFMNNKVSNTRGTLSATQLTAVNTEFNHLYVYNLQGGGFVIVSDDDRTMPVLAYSAEGFIDVNDMAPAFTNQLQIYNVQLQTIAEGGEVVSYVPRRNTRSVAPLIQTLWSQSSPDGTRYNSMLPYDSTISTHGHKPVVGCAAVAMGQIMKFWQWPIHGYGSNSYSYNYNCWNFGTLSANFDTTYYDWVNMPTMLTDTSSQIQKDAVGTLLYQCGVAVKMKYNYNCSNISTADFRNNYMAMTNHFSYTLGARLCIKTDYVDSVWLMMIKNDLDNQMPVLTRGQSAQAGGHAYVFDGYDENDYVHVNWGWGGQYNGYFSILALIPYSQYNFSNSEWAVFNLHPDYESCKKYIDLSYALMMTTGNVQKGAHIQGYVPIMNPNDTAVNPFVGLALYTRADHKFVRWLDVKRVLIPANDTVYYSFNTEVNDPVGFYRAQLFYSFDTINVNAAAIANVGRFRNAGSYYYYRDFTVVDTNQSSLSNLAIFVNFADDSAITRSFTSVDSMYNCEALNYNSIYNYFAESTYGKIHFSTVYANQRSGNSIISYQDSHTRGYYQPYSPSNPEGYHEVYPLNVVPHREAELLTAITDFIDSAGLVDDYTMIDANADSFIDNVSFIIKGEEGERGSILWPHMNFFPQDSVDHVVKINGKKLNSYHIIMEGSATRFNADYLRLGLLNTLGVPNMYHYFDTIKMADNWDVMGNPFVTNQTCMMNKAKYLHVAEPIQITEDGTYTLYSNATSDVQSCYYIKSATDSTQWFTFEYRNQNDPFDGGIYGTGLIAGRWNTNVPLGLNANAYFDNDTNPHQYWIFRPNSTCDTVTGNLSNAHFSFATGRTSFGPTTNPYPYLADATPETSFEITDIQEQGDYLTFHVHFFNSGVEENVLNNGIALYPNPAEDFITLTGENMKQVEIYNAIGQLVLSETVTDTNHCTLSIANLTPGLLLARIIGTDGTTSVVKFVKK